MNMVHNVTALTPRRQRAREARARRYLDTASRILGDDGLEALTMQRLADELDCAIGTVYRYFPSKDALIAELQREAIEFLLMSYATARSRFEGLLDVDDAPTAALTRTVTFAGFFVASQAAYPEEFNLIRIGLVAPRAIIGDEDIGRVRPAAARFFAVVRDLLEDAVSAGALDPGDASERAAIWAAAMNGTLITDRLRRFDPAIFDGRRLTMRLTENLLAGWGADPSQLQEALDRLEDLERHGPLVAPTSDSAANEEARP